MIFLSHIENIKTDIIHMCPYVYMYVCMHVCMYLSIYHLSVSQSFLLMDNSLTAP